MKENEVTHAKKNTTRNLLKAEQAQTDKSNEKVTKLDRVTLYEIRVFFFDDIIRIDLAGRIRFIRMVGGGGG